MHIVLLCGYYYPDSVGGTEAYVQMLGHDLQKMGHDVTIAAPTAGADVRSYMHDGLAVFRYPVNPSPERPELQGKRAPKFIDMWSNWLSDVKPDVVHMHSLTRGCSTAHAREVTKRHIPLFITIHVPEVTCVRGTMMRWGTTPCDGEILPVRCGACMLQKKGMPYPAAWVTSAISTTRAGAFVPGRAGTALRQASLIRQRKNDVMAWLQAAEHVIVVAGWLKKVLERNGVGAERVTVSRHGLSDDRRVVQEAALKQRAPHRSDRSLRIGFVGRFTEVKGPDLLIRAVRQLSADIDIEVHLYGVAQGAGDRAYLAGLKQAAKGDPRIQFCGPMTGENRIDAFATFDMLAVPSIWFETGPYTVLEAFSAGIPVLGSNHGGIAERVVDGASGLLVPPGAVNVWADALRRLYQQHRAGDWSWELPELRSSLDIAEEMDLIYTRAVAHTT